MVSHCYARGAPSALRSKASADLLYQFAARVLVRPAVARQTRLVDVAAWSISLQTVRQIPYALQGQRGGGRLLLAAVLVVCRRRSTRHVQGSCRTPTLLAASDGSNAPSADDPQIFGVVPARDQHFTAVWYAADLVLQVISQLCTRHGGIPNQRANTHTCRRCLSVVFVEFRRIKTCISAIYLYRLFGAAKVAGRVWRGYQCVVMVILR